MIGDGWTPFESGKRRASVRFDLMNDPNRGVPRFMRIRDRGRDCKDRGRAYITIDLWTAKVLKPVEYRPPNGGERG